MNLNQAQQKADSKRIAYDVLEGLKQTDKTDAIMSVYAAVMLALHEDSPRDKWGKKRLNDLKNNVEKRLDEYTLEELKHRVKVKIGIELEVENNGR